MYTTIEDIFTGNMLLPVWNHPTEVVDGAPAPQATACATAGQIALTYVSIKKNRPKKIKFS